MSPTMPIPGVSSPAKRVSGIKRVNSFWSQKGDA